MSPRKRKHGPKLTPEQRRQEVVELLSTTLAEMPKAVSIPPTSPHDSGRENSQESSQKALEVSEETRLSVSGDDGP